MTLCTTPTYQLQRYWQHPHILEAKYVLLAASDLWPVMEELKVASWPTLIFDVMIFPDRDREIAQLLGVILRFIDQHTSVDAVS
jgi:hypothetical protein